MHRFLEKLKNNEPAVIAFLGDSITQGCFETAFTRDGVLKTVCRPEEGYPRKVQRILSLLYPGGAVGILNYGVSGQSLKNCGGWISFL